MTSSTKEARELWYDDACGTAHALELIGERWALLVVRELMFGPRRFGELREGLPGISANILTRRLEGLETAGILVRRQLPSPANAQVYELTPWGYESEPIFQTMGRWAARSPSHDPTLPLSAASLMLSFGTMIDDERAKRLAAATVGIRLGDDTFVARLHKGELSIRREEPHNVDVTLSAEPAVLASIVYGGRSLAEVEAEGSITVGGNRATAKTFLKLFVLPPKAA